MIYQTNAAMHTFKLYRDIILKMKMVCFFYCKKQLLIFA